MTTDMILAPDIPLFTVSPTLPTVGGLETPPGRASFLRKPRSNYWIDSYCTCSLVRVPLLIRRPIVPPSVDYESLRMGSGRRSPGVFLGSMPVRTPIPHPS